MSTSSSTLNLRPVPSSSASLSKSQSKPALTPSLLKPWDFSYTPSSDGNDLNLLIMFHGVGDNKTPFFNLAKQLNLPFTAILSLSAPDPIPLMDHPSFSWYQTFTPDFYPLPETSQNPTKPLKALRKLLETLTSPEVGWGLEDIHLFGWGQGGTTALELGLDIGRNPLSTSTPIIQDVDVDDNGKGKKRLGSIVSISATLLTHLTTSLSLPTPVLYFTRQSPQAAAHTKALSKLQRAYREVKVVVPTCSRGGEDMPRGKDEWWEIMKFWGQLLRRKEEGWKGQGEVYEVVR